MGMIIPNSTWAFVPALANSRRSLGPELSHVSGAFEEFGAFLALASSERSLGFRLSTWTGCLWRIRWAVRSMARLAQSAERKALNLVVVGSSPTVGVFQLSP